jgi:hypothetical protein
MRSSNSLTALGRFRGDELTSAIFLTASSRLPNKWGSFFGAAESPDFDVRRKTPTAHISITAVLLSSLLRNS